MKLTPADWRRYNMATVCHICGRPVTADDPKVRDHDHLVPHLIGFVKGTRADAGDGVGAGAGVDAGAGAGVGAGAEVGSLIVK